MSIPIVYRALNRGPRGQYAEPPPPAECATISDGDYIVPSIRLLLWVTTSGQWYVGPTTPSAYCNGILGPTLNGVFVGHRRPHSKPPHIEFLNRARSRGTPCAISRGLAFIAPTQAFIVDATDAVSH